MARVKRWFQRQKLNVKFTLVIGILVFIPMGIIYALFYWNQQRGVVQQEIFDTQSALRENYAEVQKTVDMCNMTTQTFLNNQNLIDMLIRLKNGETISASEYVVFNREDITTLERLVNSNPYLYQTRVYAESDAFPEMMPILYRQERMQQLPWASHYVSGEWQFDYKDVIFPESVMNSAEHTMSLVTALSDYENGEIGTIEVAVRMDTIFPNVFQSDANAWSCFVDEKGQVYTNGASQSDCKWEQEQEAILDRVNQETSPQENSCFSTVLDGEQVVLGLIRVPELKGYMVTLSSLRPAFANIARQRNMILGGMILLYMVLIVMINLLVNAILRHFYQMLGTMRGVQGGDLTTRVAYCGEDEMGELGMQFNIMLDSIQRLMQENIDREVLAKNSEIRALQNQINAHFIYNVLESIKMMAEIDEKYEISDAVTSLGKLLRYSMKWTTPRVTVAEEVEYIVNYLDLINLRFDYQIGLSINMSEQVMKQTIPKMSLQPIIENAIIHGIEELAEDATIYIKGNIEAERLQIEITDSGKGMTEQEVENLKEKIAGKLEVSGGKGNGIGLKNVQDRITMTYGSDYGLSVFSKEDCFTKIIVTVPTGGKKI